MGRKAKYNKDKHQYLHFRIRDYEKELLMKLCDKHNRPPIEMIRECIRDYYKREMNK